MMLKLPSPPFRIEFIVNFYSLLEGFQTFFYVLCGEILLNLTKSSNDEKIIDFVIKSERAYQHLESEPSN